MILLGWMNGIFYLISKLLFWKWKNDAINNKVSKDYEQIINMEHIDEMDDSVGELIRISCENEDNEVRNHEIAKE